MAKCGIKMVEGIKHEMSLVFLTVTSIASVGGNQRPTVLTAPIALHRWESYCGVYRSSDRGTGKTDERRASIG